MRRQRGAGDRLHGPQQQMQLMNRRGCFSHVEFPSISCQILPYNSGGTGASGACIRWSEQRSYNSRVLHVTVCRKRVYFAVGMYDFTQTYVCISSSLETSSDGATHSESPYFKRKATFWRCRLLLPFPKPASRLRDLSIVSQGSDSYPDTPCFPRLLCSDSGRYIACK
jgi:hypothetical protein